MKILLALLALLPLLALVVVARADTAPLVKQYGGRIILSPDPAPALSSELPAYVKANAVAGDKYEMTKSSPWKVHLVGFLSKDPGGPVQLAIAEIGDKKAEPLVLDVKATNRVVISSVTLTRAAGFESRKSYAVSLKAGTAVLAKAELTLRD
jgi:hypothetical protein